MGQRIIYSVKEVFICPNGSATGSVSMVARGAQSSSISTDFRLDQIFEFGQLEIYENREDIPQTSVSISKGLDGYSPLYLMSTSGATSATLAGRSNQRCIIGMSFFDDTLDQASGTPLNQVALSGQFPESLEYNFPIEGIFTETVGFVGNHKIWANNTGYTYSFPGYFGSGISLPDSPLAGTASGGVNRRENLLFTYSAGFQATDANGLPIYASGTILPRDIDGIDSSGRNVADTDGSLKARLQSIRVSTNLGRDELFQLGKKLPYARTIRFPIDVTCEIETYAKSGDLVSATEEGVYSGGLNLRNESIRLVTSEGTRLDLGTKNKLSSINQGGGDTGGGNETITYTYVNQNKLTVLHANDPDSALRAVVFPT